MSSNEIMGKQLTYALVIAVVALICTAMGFALGFQRSKEQDRLTQEFGNTMARALDSGMFQNEPYSSYAFSLLLYEATLEEKDPLPTIQKILLTELRERKESVQSYCQARASLTNRESCLHTVKKAMSYVNMPNTHNNSLNRDAAGGAP